MKLPETRSPLWRFVIDRRLATWILAGITAVLILGSLLPNPDYMDKGTVEQMARQQPLFMKLGAAFNSRRLATGYFFGVVGIYLVVSAVICSVDRLVNRLRGYQENAFDLEVTPILRVQSVCRTSDDALKQVITLIRKQLLWFTLLQDGDQKLLFRRGSFGFWGSLLFHSVLITMLVGMVMFYLSGARGRLVITEGQRYKLEKQQFFRVDKEPLWGLKLPPVEIELLRHVSLFADDEAQTAIDHAAELRVVEPGSETGSVRTIRVNQPMRLAGADYLLSGGGFSPHFVVTDVAGRRIYDSFVNLRDGSGTEDNVAVDQDTLLSIKLFPDFYLNNGSPATKSSQLRNPMLHLVIKRSDGPVFDRLIPVGTYAEGGGLRVAVPEVRRWVELEMSNEPGVGFFFVMAFIGVVGIIIRMLDPDDQLLVTAHQDCNGVQLEFSIVSRHFPALLKSVVRDCVAAIDVGTDSTG